jgi:hypothetical protein
LREGMGLLWAGIVVLYVYTCCTAGRTTANPSRVQGENEWRKERAATGGWRVPYRTFGWACPASSHPAPAAFSQPIQPNGLCTTYSHLQAPVLHAVGVGRSRSGPASLAVAVACQNRRGVSGARQVAGRCATVQIYCSSVIAASAWHGHTYDDDDRPRA